MANKTKLSVWYNDRRETDRHPHIKAGKPVTIDGKQYWLSGWFSVGGPDDDTTVMEGRVDTFLQALAAENGNYPILKLELEEAEPRADSGTRPAAKRPLKGDEDIPW